MVSIFWLRRAFRKETVITVGKNEEIKTVGDAISLIEKIRPALKRNAYFVIELVYSNDNQ